MPTSSTVKSNGLLIGILLYIVMFGLNVNLGDTHNSVRDPSCVVIEASVIDPPPTMPIIQKEYLDNKTYVIRVLINHINALNRHIAISNKNTNNTVDKYNKCVSK